MKRIFFLILLSIVVNMCSYAQWLQKGQAINHNNESFGYSMNLNEDGTQVIIGERNLEVVVYEFDNMSWIQKGNSLNDTDGSDRYGSIVANNYAGDIIAVGAPLADYNGNSSGSMFVYFWNGNSWQQKGSRIDGASSGDQFAERSIGMSQDGLTIASGSRMAYGNASNSGHIRAFKWDDSISDWIQKGNTLNGLFQNEVAGDFVSLSADGNTLVYSDLTSDAGYIYVYEYDEINDLWAQKGNIISGLNGEGWTGASVVLSTDGNTLAYGAPTSTVDNGIGLAKVFHFNGTDWVQKGNNIVGEQNGAQFGRNVAISGDGNLLIVAAYLYDISENNETLINAGLTKVFEWDGGVWQQRGETIFGVESNSRLGQLSANISKDGTSICFIQRENSLKGAYVYEFNDNLSLFENELEEPIKVFPNPVENECFLKSSNFIDGEWVLSNELGRIIAKGNIIGMETKINTSYLSSGFYILKIFDGNKSIVKVKKMIKL